ncbi:MAG TPA: GTPase [Arthrobacter sp.]|nr:GTPase [Arthrobacter sp.]
MSRHRGKPEASPLAARLEALNSAAELGEGALAKAEFARINDVLERASTRRSLSAEHTVVGFFGATGSGKSSLFNAVSGTHHATVAARRPTTSETLAGIWRTAGSEPLLDWLQVAQRHVMADESLAGHGGLILLDLPDFDSTAVEHREIVQRLAGQVDVLVWVLDPQKYADAAVHHGFLRPLASHGAVTLVVLNQVDRLAENQLQPVLASLKDILVQDGLGRADVYPVSARTGAGIDELKAAITAFADRRQAATNRLIADVRNAAHALDLDLGAEPAGVSKPARAELADQLAQAAGVDAICDAVATSYRRQSHARTGWPVVRWLGKLRRDPLKRLNLDRKDVSPMLNRSSMPAPGPAQQAQADKAVRQFADRAGEGATAPWRAAIRRAARSAEDTLPDDLDQALARTDLRSDRASWWWPVFGVIQWCALAAALAGALWLLGIAALGYFQFPVPETPKVEGFPVPTLLLAAGILAGVLLALASGLISRLVASSRAAKARRRLRASVGQVAEERIVQPVEKAVALYKQFRQAVATAAGE